MSCVPLIVFSGRTPTGREPKTPGSEGGEEEKRREDRGDAVGLDEPREGRGGGGDVESRSGRTPAWELVLRSRPFNTFTGTPLGTVPTTPTRGRTPSPTGLDSSGTPVCLPSVPDLDHGDWWRWGLRHPTNPRSYPGPKPRCDGTRTLPQILVTTPTVRKTSPSYPTQGE